MVGKKTATPATANAALQLNRATPKAVATTSRGRDREKPAQEDVRASRYRLLDEREKARETQEIERIQDKLQQQRRPRANSTSAATTGKTPARSRAASLSKSPPRVSYRENDDEPPPYDPRHGSTHPAAMRPPHEPLSPQWTVGSGDEMAPETDDDVRGDRTRGGGAAVAPLATADFQAEVLRELQRLKEAQQKDLEAIQKLQREKDAAERKALALEATLRQQTGAKGAQARPPKLTFADLDDGDESAPPPPLSPLSPSLRLDKDEHHEDQERAVADPTGGQLSPEEIPQRWATATSLSSSREGPGIPIQRSESPVFAKRRKQQPRPSSANSQRGRTSSRQQLEERRPHSDQEHGEDDDGRDQQRASRSSSRGRSLSQSRGRPGSPSRARSASREGLRRSCSFYEDKQKAQAEEDERQREAQRRLERAARATPPANLLKRQEEAQRKKREQLERIEKYQYVELLPAKRARARNVPVSTYVPTTINDVEREQARKERLLRRSQELMAQAELPTRMQLAKEQEEENAKAMEAAVAATNSTRMAAALAMSMAVSVKARRKLQEQLDEEERRRQLMRVKPVPNFTHLQSQWEKALTAKKNAHKPTEPQRFFSARERELEELRARKDARKRKQAEKEEQARRQEAERQRELLERAKKTGASGDGPKRTKSDELRMKKVQEAIRQQRRQEEQEKAEQERRELRLKEASRRVTAQVKHGESKRKGDYAGDFVELPTDESLAKERAKTQRVQFREAVQRNKERLLASVAAKPSLMERFAIDLKREEHKKNALEAVVKQVFQKNFRDMKGILTEEEEEIAREIVAADDEAGGDASEDAAAEEEEGRVSGKDSGREDKGDDGDESEAD